MSASWKTYEDEELDIRIDYPGDYTAVMLPAEVIQFGHEKTIAIDARVYIGDALPEGHGVHVYRTADATILEYLQQDKPFTETKTVHGREYQQFEAVGMGNPYGYVTRHNGMYYVFNSTWGPQHPVTEKMMESLEWL